MDAVFGLAPSAGMADQVVAARRQTVAVATRGGKDVDQLRDSSPEMHG
jgi:hypothetical protein